MYKTWLKTSSCVLQPADGSLTKCKAQIKEIRAILKEDNSACACLNSACLSKKHANNLQLKMCQAASNQEEKYAFSYSIICTEYMYTLSSLSTGRRVMFVLLCTHLHFAL